MGGCVICARDPCSSAFYSADVGKKEIHTGQDNEEIYGAWVAENINGMIDYFEFNQDGSGYMTIVRYDKQSNTYYLLL